jgi:hypothetical protein
MANINVARGLVPYSRFDGSVWNGSGNIYYVHSTYGSNIFVGDPLVTHSASNDSGGIPAVQLGAVGSPIIGVMLGVIDGGQVANTQIAVERNLPVYHQSSTGQYILVCDDPNVLFWIQDDGGTQATAANLWPGKNAALTSGSGSTVTGYSGWQLSAASVATSSALDLKIMRALNQADNAISQSANTTTNAKWLVKLNNHQYANQEAGV